MAIGKDQTEAEPKSQSDSFKELALHELREMVLKSAPIARMRLALSIAALSLAGVPASAQQSGPFKLILAWSNGQTSPLVIDYPSQTRCEAALEAVERAAAEREQRALRSTTPGVIIAGPVVIYAICIPG